MPVRVFFDFRLNVYTIDYTFLNIFTGFSFSFETGSFDLGWPGTCGDFISTPPPHHVKAGIRH